MYLFIKHILCYCDQNDSWHFRKKKYDVRNSIKNKSTIASQQYKEKDGSIKSNQWNAFQIIFQELLNLNYSKHFH